MGALMGESFQRGLMRAAGVTGHELNLGGKLGGHHPTSLWAVGLLPLKRINLQRACPPHGAAARPPHMHMHNNT